MRPVRECSQERKLSKLRRRRILIQTLSLALWCHTWCKKERHLNSILETGERNTFSWWWYFYCLPRPGSHNYVYEAWDEAWCGSDKHWLHRTLSCFMLQAALKSPSQPSQCWVQDTKGSRMLQSLFLSLLMLASSPPFLRHQRQIVALPWTCFLREFYLLTLHTMWQTLKLVNNILP